MSGLVTLLKYTQTTITISNRTTWFVRSIQGIPTKTTYLETLTRSLPKSRNDRNKNRKEKGGADQTAKTLSFD